MLKCKFWRSLFYQTSYDNNGNLTKDSNKGIASITYNSLNLPQVVTFSNGNTITYLYTADGRKLRTVHVINGTATTTDYCGNVIYENGTQKLLLTEEGYIDLANGNAYYYYLKDHQGNNRVALSSSGAVQEVNHYYPFGSTFASSSVQPYKYNGKELDTKNGLNWYDYGARHYDAALGRWHVVDPLSEKYYSTSPYTYCLNNSVKYIDPTGMQVWILFYSSSDERFKAAAETRKKEIESMKGFDSDNDNVYIQELGDLGTLEERVSSIIDDASEKGYGKTTEVSFWSHGGTDGPIGDSKTSGDYNLMNYTGSFLDGKQLSPEGWKQINWNFDSNKSLMAFYGCHTAGFAERFFELSNNVTHTAGQGASVGPSSSIKDFRAVSPWSAIFGTSKPVYYGSSEEGRFLGVTLYKRGQKDGGVFLRKNASLRYK